MRSDRYEAVAEKYAGQIGEILASLTAELVCPPEVAKVPASAAKFYKNPSGLSPAQERKEASKRGKRLKYDLDAREAAVDEPTSTPPAGAASLDDLRARLRAKLDEARHKRGSGQANKKRRGEKEPKKREPTEEAGVSMDVRISSLETAAHRRLPRNPGAPGSKTRRLKAAAAQATERREELARLKEAGDDAAEDMEWREAMQLATGELKRRVDPAKVKKALKAREKQKAKSAAAWEARLTKRQERMALSKKERRKLDKAAQTRGATSKKRRNRDDDDDGGEEADPKKTKKQSTSSSTRREKQQ